MTQNRRHVVSSEDKRRQKDYVAVLITIGIISIQSDLAFIFVIIDCHLSAAVLVSLSLLCVYVLRY